MTLWGINCSKNIFGDTLLLTDGYGKEEFINTLIWLTKYIQKYIYAYIYINRIRGMEMKCFWMPKFDGNNKDNILFYEIYMN